MTYQRNETPEPMAMQSPCRECGMICSPVEYHPMAACLMFKGCFDGDKVRANLVAVRQDALASRDAMGPVARREYDEIQRLISRPRP